MISIIIPIYNLVFLDECLQSVYNQTFNKFEILIGLNGYKIDSEEYKKIKEYENNKTRVFQYDLADKSKTCNNLLKECRYDIICLLDVDDKWLPSKLEKQIQCINKFDVVGTLSQYFGDSVVIPTLPKRIISSEDFKIGNPIINSSSMFYKKDAYWENIFGVEDYEMWLRLNRNGKKFYNIPEILTLHRIHKNSAFNTNNKLQEENIKILKNIYFDK